VAAGLDVSFTDGLSSAMGNAQLIMINRQPRILRTGADMRREGYAIAW
jgi:gamma-glutamyltranspeptidase